MRLCGFPGPAALGRGLVVEPDADLPAEARDWPRVRVDAAALVQPQLSAVGERLDQAWRTREPVVVEMAVPLSEVKAPETCTLPPYELDPGFAFGRERLHFLIWANRYDGRGDPADPQWHHGKRALRLGAAELSAENPAAAAAGDPQLGDARATAGSTAGPAGDVLLADGSPAWIDGGPRTTGLTDIPVVHMNQLEVGSLQADRSRPPGDQLAPDQMAPVSHPGGAARVLAPAGSGKTRVLTARLRHLLVDRGWAPATLTALAYNTRAAEELRSRTTDVPGARVRTLHSLGFEIIGRSHGTRPRLLDEREVRTLLERLVPVRPRANDDVYAPYLEALAQVRAGLWSPEQVEQDRDDVPDFAVAFAAYREQLDHMGAIDFDEQIYGAIEVLLRDPVTRRSAQEPCRHLLVDELQDLTPAQLLMIRLLAAPAYDVFGVGDDDQVIYGYAGADPRFLIDYQSYFPGAASFLLEVNYRCPPEVVDAASNLLSYNHRRVPKAVRAATPADHGDADDHDNPGETSGPEGHGDHGGTARHGDTSKAGGHDHNGGTGGRGTGRRRGDPHRGLAVERRDDDKIGSRLVEAIEALVADGAVPADVAVLTRVNAGLLAPQVLLTEAGLPISTAVDDRMLERTGMRAALAWLRLAAAAGSREALTGTDLAVVARRPSRSLSPGLLKALGRGEWALGRLAGFAADLDDARLRNGLSGLHEDLARLGRLARNSGTTADLLTEVRDAVGLGRALGRLDEARSGSSSTHTDDLDALILVARAHPDPADFEPWLRRRLQSARRETTAQGLTLSTVHRVKGLEWPHVVVWDASDGVMPHRLNAVGAGREEERRVFHVALTRGRQTVTVLARAAAPSPFLAEMKGTAPRVSASAAARAADSERSVDGRRRPGSTGDPSEGRRRRGEPGGGRAGGSAGTASDAAAAGPEATRRGEMLREWRRRRAQDDGVPAYVVLHDRHLDGLARRVPTTLDELAACDGIGPTKLDRYGDDILSVLAEATPPSENAHDLSE